MEVKKAPKADLEGKKTLFFEIGLVIALGILLYAFEWKSETSKMKDLDTTAQMQIEDEVIPITQQNTPPPPPPPAAPKLADLINIVENDQDVDDDLEITDAEDETENTVVDVTSFDDFKTEDTGEQEIFQVVETMPAFPGGKSYRMGEQKYQISGIGHGKRYFR